MGDNSSVGYLVVKQVITSLTHRHEWDIYYFCCLFRDGHKEPVAATIANNEDGGDDDDDRKL